MNHPGMDGRHLTFSTLDALWTAGTPLVIPIQGSPPCRLLLDPKHGVITLVTSYQSPEPDVARLKNVGFQTVSDGDKDLAELNVLVEGSVHGAYGLLATVADELQLAKTPLAAAVDSAVSRHRNMLASWGVLTTEQEVGLYGELLLLEHLIQAVGPHTAIGCWQGPLSEEHDFVFPGFHVEVKTTSAERRRHVIHGLSQLVPLHGIPLSVVSIQLTRSGSAGGHTIPDLIAKVRKLAGGYVVPVDQRLEAIGWRPNEADLYSTRWTLRSQPRAYGVKREFPAMTPDVIGPVVPNFGLVSEVSYRVDLTDLAHDSLPEPVSGFLESKESPDGLPAP